MVQTRHRSCDAFVITLTILPFFLLAYFYPLLPERVPQFLSLTGEVETWAAKSVTSVFRVPLLAVVTQIVFLVMRYGTLQSGALLSFDVVSEQSKLQQQYLRFNTNLWDWFRCAAAIKMFAESLSTIFLSLERFKSFARPTFIITAIVSLTGVAGALFYLYRLLVVRRELTAKFGNDSVVSNYKLNFSNKWTWILIASIIAYPLIIFL